MNAEVVQKAVTVAQVEATAETKSVEVKTYPTASTMVFVYPQDGEPYLHINESMVTVTDNEYTTAPLRSMKVDFDPVATIPIIDPTTGLDTGTEATQADLLGILYSIWLQQRAIAIAAEASE